MSGAGLLSLRRLPAALRRSSRTAPCRAGAHRASAVQFKITPHEYKQSLFRTNGRLFHTTRCLLFSDKNDGDDYGVDDLFDFLKEEASAAQQQQQQASGNKGNDLGSSVASSLASNSSEFSGITIDPRDREESQKRRQAKTKKPSKSAVESSSPNNASILEGLDAEIVELLDEDSSFERNDKKIDKKSQQREAEIRNKPAEPAAEQAQNKEVDEDTDSFGFLGSLFDSFSSPAANNAEVKSATPPRPKRLLADEFFGTKGKQRTPAPETRRRHVRAAEPWPPVIINDPYKVILVNVNPIATIEDITQAVKHLVPETTISIKNVELVEQHRKGATTVQAFVSLATKQDLDTMMSDSVKAFGVHIKGQRSTYIGSEERRSIFVRGIEADDDETQILNMLISFTLDPASVEKMRIPTDDQGIPFGVALTFNTHYDAYKAVRFLSHPDGLARWKPKYAESSPRPLQVEWMRKGTFEELVSAQHKLEKDNAILRGHIAQLQTEAAAQAESVVVPEDIKLISVMFKHVQKVLETTNFDTVQAAMLLGINEGTLKRHLTTFTKEGFPVDSLRQKFMKKRVRVKNSEL